MGGKVEGATSEYDDKTWAAANVIDGAVSIKEGGWKSKDRALPQDLILSFYQTREALIGAVIIDTTTPDPLGEEDYFRLAIPGSDPAVLTLELLGRPNIRTSLTLFDAAGKSLKRFDPGAVSAQQTTFSWTVEPGEHVLQVTEPPISMVLMWDTSGSMRGSTEDLQRAVEAYLDQVRPSERLNLIRFSRRETEVLLPEFTSDRERLKAGRS